MAKCLTRVVPQKAHLSFIYGNEVKFIARTNLIFKRYNSRQVCLYTPRETHLLSGRLIRGGGGGVRGGG